MKRTHALVIAGAVGGLVPAALAQTNISPARKHAWCENVGWLNWRDAGSPTGAQGARIGATFMQGYVWSENLGYISLGDGSPQQGAAYSNADGSDAGVNIGADGTLTGYAWSENAGWINFGTAPTLAAFGQQARFDRQAGRLHGYAWGENIGWVNLDHGLRFISISCRADFNADGIVNSQDFFDFLTAFFAEIPAADFNGDAQINSQDFFDFLTAFFSGCP